VDCSLNGVNGVSVQAKPSTRPWWSYVRFSVRGLIVLVLVIGGWLGWMVRSARIQRDAVAAIEKAGGWIKYDWEWSNRNDIPGGKPWAPRWLVDLIGVDFFGHVTAVIIVSLPATDAAVAAVGRLRRLQVLVVSDSAVTDAGLVHLKGLTNLSALILDGAHVTDAGLVHLKRLTNLSELYLGSTPVTDAGLTQLNGLTNLSELHLGGTQVTYSGVQLLQKALPNLRIFR